MLKTFKKGGVHPKEAKISAVSAIELLEPPKVAYIPLSQHLGVAAEPVVKKGDSVKVGTLIAKSKGFISTNVHASVSGNVAKIDEGLDSSGYRRPMIIVNVEGDEWEEGIDRSPDLVDEVILDSRQIIEKLLANGIVGLGGATFPSHVKLMVPDGKKAEVLIINGVECEPYLTSDHRLMLEKAAEIMVGIKILMRGLGVERAIIGIENNKPDAISLCRTLAHKYQGISVQPLKVKYPQGSEKQLVKALINKEVPSGGLPIDVGAVVNNVGTAFAVYEAVQKNKPLIERVVTVTGSMVKRPANYCARVGTPIGELVERSEPVEGDVARIVSGGPMMGKSLVSLEVPVVKGTSGILLMAHQDIDTKKECACIRCARCVSVCPMGLEPYLLVNLAKRRLFDDLLGANTMDCMECGSCQYTCPSGIRVLDYIRLSKFEVGKILRARK